MNRVKKRSDGFDNILLRRFFLVRSPILPKDANEPNVWPLFARRRSESSLVFSSLSCGSGADKNRSRRVPRCAPNQQSLKDSERLVNTVLFCLWCLSDDRRRALLTVATLSPLNSRWLQPSHSCYSTFGCCCRTASAPRPHSGCLKEAKRRANEETSVIWQPQGGDSECDCCTNQNKPVLDSKVSPFFGFALCCVFKRRVTLWSVVGLQMSLSARINRCAWCISVELNVLPCCQQVGLKQRWGLWCRRLDEVFSDTRRTRRFLSPVCLCV